MAVKTKVEESALVEVSSNNALATLADYGADAGIGIDSIKQDEVLVPLFRILQSNSPQLDEQAPTYNPDAKAGMIYNTVTGEVYDGKSGLTIVIVKTDHHFLEYTNRDFGGGFHGAWSPDHPVVKRIRDSQGQFGKLRLPPEHAHERSANNELVETYSFYADVQVPEGFVINGVVPFSSTQIKKYKAVMSKFLSMSSMFPKGKAPPMFAFKWRLSTQPESNKKGKFYGWRINLEGGSLETALLKPSDDMYQRARDFRSLLDQGAVRADYEAGADEDGVIADLDSGGDDGGFGRHDTADAARPF